MKGPARKIRPFLCQIPQSDYLAHPLQSKNCDLLFPEHAITGIARRYPGDKYTTPANWQPRTYWLLVSHMTNGTGQCCNGHTALKEHYCNGRGALRKNKSFSGRCTCSLSKCRLWEVMQKSRPKSSFESFDPAPIQIGTMLRQVPITRSALTQFRDLDTSKNQSNNTTARMIQNLYLKDRGSKALS